MEKVVIGINNKEFNKYSWVYRTKVPAGYKMRYLFSSDYEFAKIDTLPVYEDDFYIFNYLVAKAPSGEKF